MLVRGFKLLSLILPLSWTGPKRMKYEPSDSSLSSPRRIHRTLGIEFWTCSPFRATRHRFVHIYNNSSLMQYFLCRKDHLADVWSSEATHCWFTHYFRKKAHQLLHITGFGRLLDPKQLFHIVSKSAVHWSSEERARVIWSQWTAPITRTISTMEGFSVIIATISTI